jgi:hypothetical protein
MIPQAGDPGDRFGKEDAPEVRARVRENLTALLDLLPPLQDMRPQHSHEQSDERHPADQDDAECPRVNLDELELDVERAAHREEQVEVREGPDHDEEDLLDAVDGERAGEARARDDDREHHEQDERPEIGRQDRVEGDGGRVRGEDLQPANATVRVRHAKDREVGERHGSRLHRL